MAVHTRIVFAEDGEAVVQMGDVLEAVDQTSARDASYADLASWSSNPTP